MEQRSKSRRMGEAGLAALCFFLVFSLFMLFSPPSAEAAETNDKAGLNGDFSSAAAGDTISLKPGQTISFGNTDSAIVINKQNLTLQGGTASNFHETIGGFSGNFNGILNARKETLTLGDFQEMVSDWKSSLTAYGSLSGITGNGGSRNITGTNTTATQNDYNKWLSTPCGSSCGGGTPYDANGLSLENLSFGNVQVKYTGPNRFVNGLIGSNHNAALKTTMGHVTGNVFTEIGVTLTDSKDTNYLAGGGVLGVRSTAGSAEIGEVSGNIFDGINILTTDDANTGATARYEDGDVKSAYLEGGGLVGVNGVSSPAATAGHALLGELSNNFFTRITIGSNDILLGGGLVGVNNNSQNTTVSETYARLGTARGNIFGSGASDDIRITLNDSLRGGGVIGVNGLSRAAAQLDSLENNAFAGVIMETRSYIRGGGIVGLQTNDGVGDKTDFDDPDMTAAPATLGNASGNLFLNQTVRAGSYIEGGGVIGLRSGLGVADLGTLTNNIFKAIYVNSGEAATISGGGVVGLSAVTQALMGETDGIKNNYFDDVHVSVGIKEDDQLIGNFLNGGGIIGVHARGVNANNYNWATIENLDSNTFINSDVLAMSINGGGIVGVNAGGDQNDNDFTAGLAAFGEIKNNRFEGLTITTVNAGDGTGHLEGGGVLGLWNKDNDQNVPYGVTAIDTVDNNLFKGITVKAGLYLQGGGIIGIRGSALEQMGEITRNEFTGNDITAGSYIDGGGIIGVTSRDGSSPYAGIKLIGDSVFNENTVHASGDVMGGIVYSYGLTNVDGGGMTIRNSLFLDNMLSSDRGIVYGAVTVDTGAEPYDNTNTLTLRADPGQKTIFSNNQIIDDVENVFANSNWADPRLVSHRTNSLYFGTIYEPGSSGNPDPAAWSPTLVVDPQAGGQVALYDPIWVNQADPDTADDNYTDDKGTSDTTDDVLDQDDYTFDMKVRGGGDFIWGGTNVFTLDTADSTANDSGESGTVTLEDGSFTTLLDGASSTTFVNGEKIEGDHVHTMELLAPNFKFTVENNATLNIEGHNRFYLSGKEFDGADPRGNTVADLNGNLHFNLHNTHVYSQGEVPNDHPNAEYQPLLTINTPDQGQGQVSLANSTVSLSDFVAGPKLKRGDRFYLIELDNNMEDDLGNKAFTGDNPMNNTASARQGFLTQYTFTIDKNMDNLGEEEDTRFLVARLTGVDPAPEFDSPNTGRITGVTVLQRTSDRLPEIDLFAPGFPAPLYELCDPCTLCGPAEPCNAANKGEARRDPADWLWSGFAEARGSRFRADAGGSHTAYTDIRGIQYLGGIAGQRQLTNGGVQLGLFVDGSNSRYDTVNRVPLPEGLTTIQGEGEIDTFGGGVLLRRNWNNGFSIDASARAGRLENRFFSGDILTHDGIPARYQLNTSYFGAGAGVNYEWQYGEKNTFDVYGRYSWHRENGGHARLSSDETVDFEALDSHRLTVGTRYTRQTDLNLSWYIGGAYERELDGSSRAAEHLGGDLVFDGVSLRGDTGVGQIGLTLYPKDNFSLSAGLEGYIGQRRGGSAFVTAGWTW